MNKKLIMFAVYVILISSCSRISRNINYNNCKGRKDLYTLQKTKDTISFKLDSVTSPNINYAKIMTINDTLFFTLLNPYNNFLYIYEYDSKKLNKVIHLKSSKKLTGYEIINWNRILTYQYWSYKLTLQDNRGKVLNSIIVPKKDDSYYAFPNSHAPIIYKDNSIYLAGGMVSKNKPKKTAPIVAQIDSAFSNIDYKYHFPDIYTKLDFGGAQYRMYITYTYNPCEDIFIFNFPASHKLFITKDFINESSYCAGSRFIKSIPEYTYKGRSDTFKYCAENGFYFCVLYDNYNDCYYRICLLPTEWNENKHYDRNLSVIILDKKFNIVGEKKLISNSDFYLGGISSVFVSPDGLLFRLRNNNGDESSINFISYKLIKK